MSLTIIWKNKVVFISFEYKSIVYSFDVSVSESSKEGETSHVFIKNKWICRNSYNFFFSLFHFFTTGFQAPVIAMSQMNYSNEYRKNKE